MIRVQQVAHSDHSIPYGKHSEGSLKLLAILFTFQSARSAACLSYTSISNHLSPLLYSCLIIGDEVLNGKTKDTNSNFLAQFCFTAGIDLKRIEVIADDEEEIIEAARRMSEKYDWVISSGGIGPTHDDITYQSMAKAFNAEPLQYE